jgi:hypothetical protein
LIRDRLFQAPGFFGGECTGVYYNRLIRDGWKMGSEKAQSGAHAIFDKPVGSGQTLRKFCYAEFDRPPGFGCYYDRHALVSSEGEVVEDLPHWQWADLDGKKALWSEDGRLFSGRFGRNGIKAVRQLHDFTGMRFEARQAPY